MMRSSYRLCSVTATRHSVGCRGATTRLLAMATLTAMSAPLCGSSSLQPCRSFATTARCHQAKTPITRSSPKITKLVKKRRLSSPSIPPKTTKVTPRTMSKRSSFMSKMRQRDPSPENGTATMQKPVVPATVAAAEQSGMVDDVGAADAQLAEQDAMHADVDDDDCPELAPSTSPDVGEAEAEELAGEIHEVADVATDIGEEATAETAAVETRSQHVPSIGSILDMESPLNLRLATLTRQHGKSFRAIAVYLPMTRTNMNFKITFEDIASQARLVCHLDEVKTMYFEWIAQFRSCYVALFVPTLQHTNATLLQNAILTAKPSRPPPPSGSYHPRLNDDPDHLIFSYAKMREIVAKKKKEETINTQLLTVTVLNAYAEEWRNFISTPMSCVPQSFFLANFNFSGKDNVLLNKELLHSQISVAADCLVAQQQYLSATSGSNTQSAARPFGTGNWSLIFVSTPPRTSAGTSAIPPMQDLLSGHFVDPLSLSERSAVYIIGSGDAALSLSCFPAARKGRVAYSIMLQDIESQLNMQRPHRDSLTMILAKAVEGFSRLTWMGLMKAETQERRKPHPVHAFYRLERRGVQREVIPSFLDGVFAPNPSQPVLRSTTAPPSGGSGNRPHHNRGGSSIQSLRHLEEYVNGIFCNADRLAQETNLRDSIVKGQVFFVHIQTAGITAARRADNPFSARNGIIFAMTQHWSSMGLMNPPTVTQLKSTHKPSGEVDRFVEVDEVIPSSLPTGPPDAPNPRDRACSAVLVAWDAKRVLLHLHKSTRLQQFLRNGGRVWCAQYAQYLLKGFSPNNLATMERTLVQYHDGPLKSAMQPLAKLKLIFSTQVDISVNTRQLTSLVHRMDGLLASAEMEMNGLQVVPQKEVNAFAEKLRLDHERLEKVLQEKIMDFTADMDGEVRKRINFRSPQDISSIIYGGAVCRHLSSRFVPVRPMRLPITSFFPHAVAQATGTPLPADYLKPTALLAAGPQGGSAGVVDIRPADVERAVRTLQAQCRHVTMDQLLASTAIVVLIARSKLGEFLEQFSLYCPTSTDAKAKELNFRVAIDDVLPVADKADIVTVTQLKELIRNYPPLLALRKNNAATAGDKRGVGRTPDLRNLLILTNCVHDRLEPLVDTGIISALEETVLGAKPTPPSSLVERVCFAEVKNALPPTPGSGDSFETDFDLLTNTDSVGFSARSTWEAHAKDIISHQGLEGAIQAMCKHSASLLGTPRDVFRSTHPIPSTSPQGIHGQEQASTSGMLWQVTPPHLHSLLKRFLKGRAASSGAEAMERVTVLLSPHKGIDLSFFSSLQQLRFTEKKLQLFEEGCLFRAVLPECNDRVHGELCHCVTATGRLSSQSPNLQNIPKEEDLRRLLVSRFGPAGRMVEADYSQLEVVVLAALSRDAKMIEEIKDKVDFHCMRVSLMRKEPYADVVRKAKVLKDPEYIQLRQQAKVFSFQRQYGAGVMTIATTTGLSEQEVESLIAAEEQHYKELGQYYTLVSDCVEAGADRLLRLRSNDGSQWPASLRRVVMLTEPLHYFVAPTGSKFDFGKDRKSIPRLKNYPVQGLAGEIVQVMCGKVLREFYRKRNYNNRAFLVNTVHDCVWVDAHASVADEVKADLHRILRETQQVIGGLWPEMKLDVPFNAEVHVGKSLGDMSS